MPSLPNFCSGTYVSESPNQDPEECINLFPKKSESEGAKSPMSLFLVPGKRLGWQLPEAGIYSIYPVNGRVFVAGASLWELFADGTKINRGSLGAIPTRPTQMISNEDQLLAMNNGDLYVLTLSSNAFAAVNMAQFNGPVSQIDFCDGYGLATLQDSHTFQQSNLEDFLTWDGLNVATVSYFPDNFTSMKVDHREVWFYSGKKTIAYQNYGAGFPVFQPVQGAYMEFGAYEGATFVTCQADNTLVWIDQDERGALIARKAVGYGEQRISTDAVEYAWQQFTSTQIANLIAFTYQESGSTFWAIKFPGISWVYDFSTGLWAKRGFYNTVSATYEADHAQSHAYGFGSHLVGDWASGNIYRQSLGYLRDNGNPIRWLRRTPILSKDNKWIRYKEIELDAQTGLVPEVALSDGAGDPRPAQTMLRWSNNFGQTWSNEYILSAGFPGEYDIRIRRTMLGQARKRVFEWSGSDPISWRIADCYLEANPSLE